MDAQQLVRMLKTEQIRTDGGTQPRVEINERIVAEYAEETLGNDSLPPVVVFFDGADHWLADGFHRYWGHQRAGQTSILAEVRKGTRRDAVLYSVGANATHGLRRTNEDKRKAVETLLQDAEWGKWSDNEIARRCNVSPPFVSGIRKNLTINIYSEIDSNDDQERTYTNKSGTVSTMKTGNIGKPQQPSEPCTDNEDDDPFKDVSPWQGISQRLEDSTGNDDELDDSDPWDDEPTATAPPPPAPTGPGEVVGEIMADGETVFYKDDPSIRDDEVFDDEPSEVAPVNNNELDDEAWVQALPLTRVLASFPGALTFRDDALAWRLFNRSGLQGKVKFQADVAARANAGSAQSAGAFTGLMGTLGRCPHPEKWELCAACGGSGMFWMNRTTQKHEAPATVAADTSNEFALRCTREVCKRCQGGYRLP